MISAMGSTSANWNTARDVRLIIFRDFDRLWYRLDDTGFNKIGYVTQHGTVVHPRWNRGLTQSSLDSILRRPHKQLAVSATESQAKNIETFFADNVPSIELFEAGIIALKDGLLSYFDNPIRLPKLEDINGVIFEERWKILRAMLHLGDVIFAIDTKNIISRLIARFDHGSWSHVGLCSGESKITEAIPIGVVERSIEAYHNPRYRLGLYRRLDLDQAEQLNVVSAMKSKIDARYNFRGVIYLAIHKLLGIRPHGEGSYGPNDLARSERLTLVHLV
jgi:hypothetical protein